MNILFLTNYFPPEVGTGPHQAHEMGEWLVNDGHNVTIVTGFPRYNVPVLPKEYRGRLLVRETTAGMDVFRINTPISYGASRWSRGMAQLLSPPAIALRAMFCNRPDVVITVSPPLLLATVARWIARRFRAPCVVYVTDLFPQTIVDAGLLRNRSLIKFFEGLERRAYKKSSGIAVLSERTKQYVVNRGAKSDNVAVVPSWADIDAIRPASRMNDFRKTNGLQDKFVVLFAGTMGFFQGLNTVIDAAKQLANEPDLVFLMVGDGAERGGLEQQATGLSNVKFLPIQPKSVYPQVLAACDVALVTLRPEVSTPTVPSKLMTIMAAGRPVLASLPPDAGMDVERHISAAQCGLFVPAGDPTKLAAAILQMKQGRENTTLTMGINARHYVEKHLSRDECGRKFRNLLVHAVADKVPELQSSPQL